MSISLYSFRTGSELLLKGDLENMMTLVFNRIKFYSLFGTKQKFLQVLKQKFYCKLYVFTSSPQCCIISELGFGIMSVVRLWYVIDVYQKSNGLRTEPCRTPAVGLICWRRNHFLVNLVGRSSIEILPQSIVPNIIEAFSTSRNVDTTCPLS